jgi:hypothetical protein
MAVAKEELIPQKCLRVLVSLRTGIGEHGYSGVCLAALRQHSGDQRFEDVAVVGRIFRDDQDVEAQKAASIHPSVNSSPRD